MNRQRTMTIPSAFSLFAILATVLLRFSDHSEAFQISTVSSKRSTTCSSFFAPTTPHSPTVEGGTTTTTQLHNLFGNLFGQEGAPASANNNDNNSNNPVVNVLEIPTKVLKTKPLKFFLQIFFAGQQNTPFQGAWLLNANEEVEEYLEVYFGDGSGMLSVQFDTGYGLRIQRKGKQPSLRYMLQESVLLHKVLDELEAMAFGNGDDDGDDVKDEDRLLQFPEDDRDVLSRARAKLPARAAPDES